MYINSYFFTLWSYIYNDLGQQSAHQAHFLCEVIKSEYRYTSQPVQNLGSKVLFSFFIQILIN